MVMNEGTWITTPTGPSRPRRRSLARTMALVAVIAADLAALRACLPMIPNPGLVLMVLVLEVGLFRVSSRRGEARAFWIGFEVSGWVYVLICSIFARTAWRLARSLFERMLLGRPVVFQPEVIQYLLFAGVLQFSIALALSMIIGLIARSLWRHTRPSIQPAA